MRSENLKVMAIANQKGDTAMKKKILFLLFPVVLVILVIAIVIMYPFSTSMEETVQAFVFKDNRCVSETTVKINGEINGRGWDNNKTYVGTFGVEFSEATCREGVQARIEWKEGENFQSILFFNNSDFTTLETKRLIINNEMDEIALEFDDGTIIATSEEMYEKIKNGGQ